ncbi:MAG TPA: RHS repeat-associated core domain-containing protein [Verrucomicrobiales bacterium]|nr:RHS repeat-associated core domain-containing protein [Verrucomicrobiales bacterium]
MDGNTTAPDNTQSIRTFAGGRLASTEQKDTAGTVISSSSVLYDAHGRVYSTTDPRSGVTLYTYYDDDAVETVTTPDPDGAGPLSPQVTTTTYTNRGQTDVVTLPDGTTQDRDYYPTGEVEEVTGTAAPAVAYTYDYVGRILTLTTQPGTGAAAATTWTYHSTSGLLASKIDAANSGTESFTWTAGGRALTKTNARGTTVGYFYGSGTSGVVAGSGDLTDVTYTDSTPAITYTFDRLGRMATAVSGGVTRSLSLALHGQRESEAWTGGPLDGLTVDPGFDSLRRRNSLAVTGSGGTVPSQSYSYDTLTGELSTISTTGPGLSGTATAAYAYRTGTRQIASVTFAESATTRLTQTRAYDDLHRLTGVTSQTPGPVDLAASSYTLDDAGRRSSTLLADGTWWKYTYDDHGQVLSAERRRMTGTTPNVSDPAVPGQQFTYSYDGLGNRVAAIQGGAVTDDVELDYTATTANQYSAITHTRTGIVTGIADASATVTVNSNAAARSGPWWAQSESTSTGSSAAWLDFSIDATLGGSTDHADTQLLVPPASVSPAYDADGNLTDDGLRTFTWDAENRLLQITTKDTLLPAGAAMYRVSYAYDDTGRRIAQTVETRTSSSGAYVLASRRCFLFSGWSCLAEYDYAPSGGGATRALFRSQVWGADFGGGGAGGLILIRRHTGSLAGTHFATHDGNGNITALVNAATGLESARYDYDPFGNLLRATGPFAAENPYRFSTQFTDEVTGLLYYGYRHYDPVHGRWLSRDPIGEAGGINLYGFVGNETINSVDILGLDSTWSRLRGVPYNEIEQSLVPAGSALLNLQSAVEILNRNGNECPCDPETRKRLLTHYQIFIAALTVAQNKIISDLSTSRWSAAYDLLDTYYSLKSSYRTLRAAGFGGFPREEVALEINDQEITRLHDLNVQLLGWGVRTAEVSQTVTSIASLGVGAVQLGRLLLQKGIPRLLGLVYNGRQSLNCS